MALISAEKDPMGQAIADYYRTGEAKRLRVISSMFDEDEIPVSTLFRGAEQMNAMERTALDAVYGRILDVGAGSGCHSLVLQERGHSVRPSMCPRCRWKPCARGEWRTPVWRTSTRWSVTHAMTLCSCL